MADSKKFSPEFWRAVAWTGIYVLFMWAILRGLFNFNMFSVAHWSKMSHIELHGFPGLVFGILILAAVPLYVATTVFTFKNKMMPIKFPLPNCFTKPTEAQKTFVQEPIVTEHEELLNLPTGVPAEMRESFMRARKNCGVHQMSVFNRPAKFDGASASQVVAFQQQNNSVKQASISPIITENSNENTDFPVPTDFDTPPAHDFDVPVFQDIKFDDDDNEVNESVNTPNVPEYASVQEFIAGAGHKTEMNGNLIVVNGFAIAVHNDDDFWVADEIDWFAAGRQKPSPIVELTNAQKDAKLQPVLYLGQDNIMDLDKLTTEWRNNGINVVTNQDDLLKLIKSAPNA